MTPPLCVDLFCGLGGWSEGFLAEGWRVVGFDIERHDYGAGGYPGELVLQDVLTLHGRQFKNAACIVASPPCQEFSYMAMPWKRAKQIALALRGHGAFPEGYTGSRTIAQLTALFDACFRIQREASEAAGHHIPLVVENVKGAQPWVGRANANYGSFYLWGDVRSVGGRIVAAHRVEFGAPAVRAFRGRKPDDLPPLNGHDDPRRGRETTNGSWFAMGANGKSNLKDGRKVPMNFHEHEKTGQPGRSFQSAAVAIHAGVKQPGHSGRARFADPDVAGHFSSKSSARKAASAQIAKIPLELARYIARSFKPDHRERVA